MVVGFQKEEQVIEKFRHNYVRFDALKNGLILQQPCNQQSSCEHDCPALDFFSSSCHGSNDYQHPGRCNSQGDLRSTQNQDSFIFTLAAEVDRVRLFIKSYLEQLWVQLLDIVSQIKRGSEVQRTDELLTLGFLSRDILSNTLDAFGEDLCGIESFGRQNVMLCALLAQMKDKQCYNIQELPVESPYLACMECQILGDYHIDPLILGLSDTYELFRQVSSNSSGEKQSAWVPPEKFQRLTRKFWIMPADVTKFKCNIIKHLPILVFENRQKLTEVDDTLLPLLSKQHDVSDSGLITSVYYDNPEDLNTYHTRLRKDDYATAVRVRWYGQRGLSGNQQLFVERKQHRDSWSGHFSSKDRAPMQQRYLSDYMAGLGGPPGMDGESSKAALLREVQDYVAGNKQVPLLRTVYRRTAFQKTSNNLIRISLDTELRMVKEMGAPRIPGDWCRDCSDSLLSTGDVAEFPYAVVEIKLQAKPPDWILDLVHSGILLPLPRFSKFLHGVACLYQHMTDQLPNWFLPDDTNPTLMTPATWEEMADTSDEYLKKAASWLFPASFDPASASFSVLSFLRRKKALTAASDGPGSDRAAAAATARQVTEFELACERLPEAEQAHSEGEAAFSQRKSKTGALVGDANMCSRKEGRGSTGAAGGKVGSPLRASVPAAVARMQTWPQSCTSAAAKGAGEIAKGGFLPPSYAALGYLGAGGTSGATHSSRERPSPHGLLYSSQYLRVGSHPLLLSTEPAAGSGEPSDAIEMGQLGRVSSHPNEKQQGIPPKSRSAAPSSEYSANETPVDSAKDVESGKGAEASRPVQHGGAQPSRLSAGAYGSQLYQAIRGSSRRTAGPGSPLEGGAPGSPTKGSSRASALVRTRVEPKTFFANERTFLQWLQISVLVMMIAFALLSGTLVTTTAVGTGASTSSGCPVGDKSCVASKISGAIIAPVALLFMGYSLLMYKKRTVQILRRQTVRYDDQRGPVALVSILLIVMITAYVISLIWIF